MKSLAGALAGAAWLVAFIFVLVLPVLLLHAVDVFQPGKESWVASIVFARLVFLCDIPLVWWVLSLPRAFGSARKTAGALIAIVFVFWALTVQEIPCGC